MQQHGSKYFARRVPTPTTTLTLGLWVKRSNSTVSEPGHIAYQIKGNHKCSNMVAHILPADPPDPWWGQKVKI